ncbi:exodeoxyribonuclease VII large subunit [soil metagenome]
MQNLTAKFPTLEQKKIYQVSGLNRQVRELLESELALVWVEGELSNVAIPSSGHIYFSLKDKDAQVRCAFFRNRSQRLSFTPKDGMHVLIRALVSLYEGRGEFQLIVEYMEEMGDGALQRAFEILKKRLAAEGLFETANKKRLPRFPKQIGVITSPTGAAIRDILSVLQRRFPSIPVVIYPTAVQGDAAAAQIVQAIQIANLRQECDVLLLSRGGGSLEDLWPFNEEIVARAIYASTIAIVSGVGHEIDFTIADFVADQRAATPSAAAELVTPSQTEWLQHIDRCEQQLLMRMRQVLLHKHQQLEWLTKRLQHPGQRIQECLRHLALLTQALQKAWRNLLNNKQMQLGTLLLRLRHCDSLELIATLQSQQENRQQRLAAAMQQQLKQSQQRLNHLQRALEAVNPLAVLNRGYAIITSKETGKVIYKASDVQTGEKLTARLSEGTLETEVYSIAPQPTT